MLTDTSLALIKTVRATIPIISSIIAAPTIVVPDLVLSLPVSLRVSTEIVTDVAIKMTPINIYSSSCC